MILVLIVGVVVASIAAVLSYRKVPVWVLLVVGVLVAVLAWAGTEYLTGYQILREVCPLEDSCVFDYAELYSGEHPNPAVNRLIDLQEINHSAGLAFWSILFLGFVAIVRTVKQA